LALGLALLLALVVERVDFLAVLAIAGMVSTFSIA